MGILRYRGDNTHHLRNVEALKDLQDPPFFGRITQGAYIIIAND
jgi:hypothetical protein